MVRSDGLSAAKATGTGSPLRKRAMQEVGTDC